MTVYNEMELFPLYIHSAYDDEFDNADFIDYIEKYRDKYPSETVSNMGGISLCLIFIRTLTSFLLPLDSGSSSN